MSSKKPARSVRSRSRADARDRAVAVDELMTTTALLYFRMRLAAQDLLGEGELSAGRRSVLRSLARSGAQTVPQMARVRAVSRQHVQKLVNALETDGLVERVANPAHKRSRLVRLTGAGRRLVEETRRREALVIPALAAGIPLDEVRTATRVLQELKRRFEGSEWRAALARTD